MVNTISVGALGQNPTRMLREVKAGATYVITDLGEPVAEVAPGGSSGGFPRHPWEIAR